MLPDYPSTKAKLRRLLDIHLRAAIKKELGPLALIPPRRVFEGRELMIENRPRERSKMGLQPISASIELKAEEIANLNFPSALKKVEEVAHLMAKGQSEFSYRRIQEDLDAAGQRVDARGGPLTPDLFFEVLEKIQLDFNDEGVPVWPVMVVGPALAERAAAVLGQVHSDPHLLERLIEIVERKRAEFNVRESTRRLVG